MLGLVLFINNFSSIPVKQIVTTKKFFKQIFSEGLIFRGIRRKLSPHNYGGKFFVFRKSLCPKD